VQNITPDEVGGVPSIWRTITASIDSSSRDALTREHWNSVLGVTARGKAPGDMVKPVTDTPPKIQMTPPAFKPGALNIVRYAMDCDTGGQAACPRLHRSHGQNCANHPTAMARSSFRRGKSPAGFDSEKSLL
jgi:hypothetical protein